MNAGSENGSHLALVLMVGDHQVVKLELQFLKFWLVEDFSQNLVADDFPPHEVILFQSQAQLL